MCVCEGLVKYIPLTPTLPSEWSYQASLAFYVQCKGKVTFLFSFLQHIVGWFCLNSRSICFAKHQLTNLLTAAAAAIFLNFNHYYLNYYNLSKTSDCWNMTANYSCAAVASAFKTTRCPLGEVTFFIPQSPDSSLL